MSEIQELTAKVIKFRDQREWKQFHNPKDLALSLVLEATEVLEHFQWKNGEKLEKYTKENKKEIAKELADVLNYLLIICHDFDIDIKKALEQKLKENNKKYPVSKAKGNATKYNKL
jgi:NTP pyrophosphatase (non-canonical NTP hydrolase)